VGLALQEQRKFAEAVAEFAKLIASNVNDRELADTGAQDYKNYRHKAAVRMSECYEATKDYARAAEFALHARDRYAYQSWCKTCAQAVEESLNKRIKLLQELAAAAP
jgi:biopolymer transport protein ExbB/TolQ